MSIKIKKEYLTFSPQQTESLGKRVAGELLVSPQRETALLIALLGDLGGGKTTFLKGLAKGLGVKEKILSPTFILMRRFKICENSCPEPCKFASFYHIDCYRIKEPKEILTLGFKKIITDPKNIVAIEWAERIKDILPRVTVSIKFEFKEKNQRKIIIQTN